MTAIDEAIALMKQALAILDGTDAGSDEGAHIATVACAVQQAIDQAECTPNLRSGEEIADGLLDAFEARCERRVNRTTAPVGLQEQRVIDAFVRRTQES